MKISDVLAKENILANLDASDKRAALDEMCRLLDQNVSEVHKDMLLELLLDREQLGSTGIGFGVAVPHVKLKGLESIIVGFARSKDGINFQAMDNKPVHLLFFIVAPESSTVMHLKILAAVSKLLKSAEFRTKLLSAASKEDIYRAILEEETRQLNTAV